MHQSSSSSVIRLHVDIGCELTEVRCWYIWTWTSLIHTLRTWYPPWPTCSQLCLDWCKCTRSWIQFESLSIWKYNSVYVARRWSICVLVFRVPTSKWCLLRLSWSAGTTLRWPEWSMPASEWCWGKTSEFQTHRELFSLWPVSQQKTHFDLSKPGGSETSSKTSICLLTCRDLWPQYCEQICENDILKPGSILFV